MTAKLGVARAEEGPGQPQDRGHYELRPKVGHQDTLELVWCQPGQAPAVQSVMAEAGVPLLAAALGEYMTSSPQEAEEGSSHYELRPNARVSSVLELVWSEPGQAPAVKTTMGESRVVKLAVAVGEYMQRRQQPQAQ